MRVREREMGEEYGIWGCERQRRSGIKAVVEGRMRGRYCQRGERKDHQNYGCSGWMMMLWLVGVGHQFRIGSEPRSK